MTCDLYYDGKCGLAGKMEKTLEPCYGDQCCANCEQRFSCEFICDAAADQIYGEIYQESPEYSRL